MANKTDSVSSAEDRSARMKAEYAQHQQEREAEEQRQAAYQAKQDEETRKVADKDLERAAETISEIGSRDQLLDYIRAMREEKKPEPEPEVFWPESLLKQRQAEEEMGRKMVAKYEEAERLGREARLKSEAEEKARQGTMTPVHHPNPSQEEQYPASQATLGKKK